MRLFSVLIVLLSTFLLLVHARIDVAKRKKDAYFNFYDLVGELPPDISTLSTGNDQRTEEDKPASPLNPNDFRRAADVPEVSHDSITADGDPILLAQSFEGDIDNVRLSDLEDLHTASNSNPMTRNAIKDTWRKWPNAVVPYVVSKEYSKYERSVMAKAVQEYHERTCIRFVPRTNERDYIHIVKGRGCSSSVGRTGNSQSVSLGNGCVYKGIVQHELMHALGFWHEQSRADRDSSVQVVWSNIDGGMKYNFMKYSLSQIDHLHSEYDTCSIMHYGEYAFSKNNGKTIRCKGRSKCKLGQRNGFSDMDIKKINTLYNCEGFEQTTGEKPTKPKPSETTPTIKPDLTCQDTHKYCATWASTGECQENPNWMLKNCPVSCKECENKCADHDIYCNDWKKSGECKKNAAYMDVYCARSCGKCKAEDCKDSSDNCEYWKDKGYCESKQYKDYMKMRCKMSCGHCL